MHAVTISVHLQHIINLMVICIVILTVQVLLLPVTTQTGLPGITGMELITLLVVDVIHMAAQSK